MIRFCFRTNMKLPGARTENWFSFFVGLPLLFYSCNSLNDAIRVQIAVINLDYYSNTIGLQLKVNKQVIKHMMSFYFPHFNHSHVPGSA